MMIKENIEFVVPCGNFGNVCAGIFAKKMGLPFEKFLVVNNMNDPVLKYYQTGIFEPKTTVVQTLSTAMDIGNPSNFIRILEVFGHDHAAFKKVVKVLKVTDQKTVETIKKVYKKYQYELDPHTAVAWNGAEKDNDPGYLKVILSTASPLKFADVINQRAGIVIDDSEVIKELEKKAKRKITINNDYDEFKKTIISLPL
jgi:threonine synthase